jgi:hypothetical protein
MRRANIKGALVGVEAVTPEGLKAVYKDFNYSGDRLVEQLQTFRIHGIHVLGSFIFGLPTDKPSTFGATGELALKAGVTFAQFVMMTPFPGTVDFGRWEKEQAIPAWPHISRTWLQAHPWLWQHSDDRTQVRLYIDSWFVAIAFFVIAWLGAGSYRRRSLIVSGANILGFPALLFTLLALYYLTNMISRSEQTLI